MNSSRLTFVDGIRAIAALAVFGFHISSHLNPVLQAPLSYGWLGVPAFFAISGFVIAQSLSSRVVTFDEVVHFFRKRILRIVPTYWAALLFVLGTLAFARLAVPSHSASFPTVSSLVAHALFLQDILKFDNFLDVTWSLCIEMQFYLVFALLMMVIHRVAPHFPTSSTRNSFGILVLLSLVVANIVATQYYLRSCRPWVIGHWNQFFCGILACWVARAGVSAWWFVPVGVLVLTPLLFDFAFMSDAVAFGTSGLIVLSTRYPTLGSCLDARWIQYFAAMSYSFYLIHNVVLARLVRLLSIIHCEAALVGWLVATIGLALSVIAAVFLFRLVERPSMRFGTRRS